MASRLRRLRPHLRGASSKTLAPDLVAGLTVAALAVPQGMAYALVAGVPLEMGLWAAALPALIAPLFGSSPYLVTGPTQPVALVLGLSVVAPVVLAGGAPPIAVVLSVGLVAGVVLLAFGLLGLGRASRFLSDSVVSGLVVGVGVLIIVGQIPHISGMSGGAQPAGSWIPNVWPMLVDALGSLRQVDARALALAGLVPALVVLLRRVDLRIPGALLALGAASLLTRVLGWDSGPDALVSLPAVAVTWPVVGIGLASPEAVGAPALAIALLVTVQSTAAARALARPGDQPVDPDRELVAQGAANLTASVFGAIPTSGSFSRSSLARSAGARSRLAPAFSGLVVLALLPVVSPALAYLPRAALAGIVILAGFDLIDPRALRRAAGTRGDAAVLAVTLAATLWLDVVQAIYAGVFLSLLLMVRRGGRLQMVELVRAGSQRLREIQLDARTGTTPAVLLHLEGDLNFAVAPELSDRLLSIGSQGPRVLILRLKRARHLDSTVIEALRRVAVDLQNTGTTVILCGLTDDLARVLEGSDLAITLGPEGILRTGPRLMEGFERALERARELLKPLPDDAIFRREEPGSWSYEI